MAITSSYAKTGLSAHPALLGGTMTFNESGLLVKAGEALLQLLGYPASHTNKLKLNSLLPDVDLGLEDVEQLSQITQYSGHKLPIRLIVHKLETHEQTYTVTTLLADNTETLAQNALQSVSDGIIATDMEGKVILINVAAEELSGWSHRKAIGLPLGKIFRLINEHSRRREPDLFIRTMAHPAGRISSDAILFRNRQGKEFNIEYTACQLLDTNNLPLGAVLSFRDTSEKHRVLRQIAWQAHHDPLTGLINRKEMENRLELAIDSASKNKREHALLYVDLDQFKVVNDTCGHQAGDELLRQISGQLGANLRHRDALGRLGGDEFGILLENCSIDQAQSIAESIRKAVQEYRFVWENRVFQVGASIGVVAINQNSNSKSQILGDADNACYTAKNAGRNRIQLHCPDHQELAMQRREMHWASNIEQVIDEGRFRLYFQRIQPIGSAQPLYWEVLIRMMNEKNELELPGQFLPAAERYDMMENIDKWVFSNILELLQDLRRQHRPLPFLSINLSTHSLGDETFLPYVLNQFKLSGIPERQICFEITESTAIANFTRAREFVKAMRARGCKFALDDFGSGMSSFGYIKNLTVDYIKIDGGFVRNINRDIVDLAMVESINRIGHLMKIETIAESAESETIINQLGEIGVSYAQGFGIQQPLSQTDFINSYSLTYN